MILERRRYKHTGCNLKTKKLLDCALIGVCAVISLNTVYVAIIANTISVCFTVERLTNILRHLNHVWNLIVNLVLYPSTSLIQTEL